MLIKRAQGTNDHLAMHMKCLEKHRLKEITNMTTYDKLFATEREKSRRRWPKCLPDTMEVNELTTEDANGKPETPRLPRLGSIMRVYDAWVAIAAFFVVLWAVMGGWILFTLW
jgi:hypothetical protein